MEEIRFEVRHPDGRTEHRVVQAARATVGAGAHCDVRLAPDQALPEHVLVELIPNAMQIQSVISSPPATLDGAPFTMKVVPDSTLLVLASTQIRVTRVATGVAPKQGFLNVGTLLRIAVVALLPVAYLMLPDPSADARAPGPKDLPEIFPSATVACPRSDPEEARSVAEDQRAVAEAARERSPFAPHESITAAKAGDLAAACYRVAHDEINATESEALSKGVREATLLDVRARRVRLERLLLVNDYELAKADVAFLSAVTEGRPGPFAKWLAGVDQRIKSQRGATPP